MLTPFSRFIAVACVLLAALTVRAAGKPNVLFFFTDDQRADTIHALGNSGIQTPNLDRLVHAGTTVNNGYCMGGYTGAVCLPSRQMLLTGRSWFAVRDLPKDAPSFPASMKAAGYITYHHGKAGNSPHNIHEQFDFHHYLSDNADRTSGYPGKPVADDGIAFLDEWKSGKFAAKPFFMYLAFGNPHDPRIVNDEYLSKYKLDTMALHRNYLPFHPFDNGELLVRDERLAAWPRTEAEIRKHLRDYYGVISYMDSQIGRIMDHLKTVGADQNTIMIFSSDQGLAVGSHGLMGKQSVYEDSMGKVPMIFAGPGIGKGKRTDAMVYLLDVFPTVLDLVGAPAPAGLDGRSFAPVLRGDTDKARDTIFMGYRDFQRSVRRGDWKLIRYPQINRNQLFNLAADPDETKDLAADPGQAGRIAELMGIMAEQQKLYGDKAPLTVDKPRSGDIDLSYFQKAPSPAAPKKKAKKK